MTAFGGASKPAIPPLPFGMAAVLWVGLALVRPDPGIHRDAGCGDSVALMQVG